MKPETFARLRGVYSEREISDIVWLVASEHLWNMANLGLGIGSDGFCELDPPVRAAAQGGRSTMAVDTRKAHL